jgi:hypothetical protein
LWFEQPLPPHPRSNNKNKRQEVERSSLGTEKRDLHIPHKKTLLEQFLKGFLICGATTKLGVGKDGSTDLNGGLPLFPDNVEIV